MKYYISTILVGTALALSGCGWGSGDSRNPYSMIADGVPPASFMATNSVNTSMGIDGNFWMQFSVATQDIAKVVAAGQYTTNASPTSFTGMYPPKWWNEPEWRKHMTYYEWKRYHRTHKDILQEQKIIWIDRQTGEAFFARATF